MGHLPDDSKLRFIMKRCPSRQKPETLERISEERRSALFKAFDGLPQDTNSLPESETGRPRGPLGSLSDELSKKDADRTLPAESACAWAIRPALACFGR
jgi:hypothetical protein